MLGRFIKELNRRNVFRVAAIYFVVSWLLMQIGDVMFDALLLPEWTTTMLAAFLILGLPIALIFAWAYEITPDGVLRTEDVPEEHSITGQTGQKINYLIIAGLAVAVCVLLLRDFYGTIRNDRLKKSSLRAVTQLRCCHSRTRVPAQNRMPSSSQVVCTTRS